MNTRRTRLSVVCPCYNEAEVIALFYEALKPVLASLPGLDHRIIFVDDGSSDGTIEQLNLLAARDECVQVYSLSRNFGHQVALSAGLDVARGDAVVMMDSDLQHPPALVPQMVELWQQGHDGVSAVRETTADASWFKRFTSSGFYRVVNLLSDTPIVPGAADFCLLSRRAHQALRKMPERHRFLRGMVSWIGFRRAFVPYEAAPRAAGHTKYTLRRMLALGLDATFAFSSVPIKLATRLGFIIVLLGFAYLVSILIRFFLGEDLIKGWSSVICSLLLLGGLQLIFTGLIGEYLGRIFEQGKARPLYLFKQTPRGRLGRTFKRHGDGSEDGLRRAG